MNKAQFLHIITSLWKLCGMQTLILLKITTILKSCFTHSTCTQAFSRKNSLTFLQVSKSTKGFLTDVRDNSAELIFIHISRERAFSIMYMLIFLQMIMRKGFVTHITQKKITGSIYDCTVHDVITSYMHTITI